MATSSIDGRQLKRRFRAGVDRLSQHVELINQLNVFPVPDGDTGINMFHTLRRAYAEIAEDDSEDVGVIADRFAHGALMGARGNSGTILSQLLKGFADGLQAPTLRPSLLRRACQAAVKQAYSSLSKPTEGTMLTVAREAAESLGHEASGAASLKEMLEGMTAAALASLENTPNLLPILSTPPGLSTPAGWAWSVSCRECWAVNRPCRPPGWNLRASCRGRPQVDLTAMMCNF